MWLNFSRIRAHIALRAFHLHDSCHCIENFMWLVALHFFLLKHQRTPFDSPMNFLFINFRLFFVFAVFWAASLSSAIYTKWRAISSVYTHGKMATLLSGKQLTWSAERKMQYWFCHIYLITVGLSRKRGEERKIWDFERQITEKI